MGMMGLSLKCFLFLSFVGVHSCSLLFTYWSNSYLLLFGSEREKEKGNEED